MTDVQFSTRDVPWMRLGTEVDEAVTAVEAIKLADLDWDVEMRPDLYPDRDGQPKVDPSKRKLVRIDTDDALGTVSPTYEVMQYREAFTFMDEINPEYVAAGSLKNGRQAFVVVQVPSFTTLNVLDGEDPHDLYVVLRASHDGSRPVEVNLLPLRSMCMNMMPLPSFGKDALQRWSVRHTKNMRGKLAEAKRVLTNLDGYTESYRELADRLAHVELDLEEARRVVHDSLPSYLKTDRETDAIMDVYETSPRNGYRGTAWGVLNAVTEHYDHFRGGDDRRPETRWVQGLDGSTTRAIDRTVRRLTR